MSENIRTGILVLQIVVSVLLIISILLQNRAEGLGQMFGGGGEVFRTKRGLERFLFYATIVLIIVFAALSFLLVKFS